MTVRNTLIGLLVQQPRHGYELHAAFEAMVGGENIWDVKPSQIYTTLSRLKESGLITEIATGKDRGPEKRIFQITPKGKQELIEWLSTPVLGKHQRDEFFIKLMIGLAAGEVDPYTIIYSQRIGLYRELHNVTKQRESLDPTVQLAHVMMLDRVIMHLEADLNWLSMIESRIDDIKNQPIPKKEEKKRGRPKKD